MSNDKYGNDWKVWGNTSSSTGEGSSNPFADSVGSGWGTKKNADTQEECDDSQDANRTNQTTAAKLVKAELLTDDTTDFNKPCKVRAQIESQSPVTTPVTFSLWAKYKDVDYDLKSVSTAHPEDNVANSELKLFFVDPYYDDAVVNHQDGVSVEYYLKVSLKGAKSIESSLLTMPIVASRKITLHFKDDQDKPICGMTVYLEDNSSYTSDESGIVEIESADGVENINIIKIEMAQSPDEQ